MADHDPVVELIQAAQAIVHAEKSPSEQGTAHDFTEAFPRLERALADLHTVAGEVGTFTEGRFGRILTAVFAADDAAALDMHEDELDLLHTLADGANELEGIHATVRSCVLEHYDLFSHGDLEKLRGLERLLTDALVEYRHLDAWAPFAQPKR